ncbi:YfcE family phosphodiesterase [Nitratifractor sp.]|uniref:YfcE family phosphodiesterase n=1 Tax=Nitratifractor sp. TaxID=2268144 RepID=UPI0025DDA984|nr:YfcE family phosphodiesterase [Nitratifractor sp.]
MALLKIGVLSDPHRRSNLQREAIGKLLEEGAEYFLHAGDLCLEENLRQLADAGIPYAAVFGNNDRSLHPLADKYRIRPEPWYFKIGDLKVKMMHLPYYMTPDTDLVIYGHTHRFNAELKGSTFYLNPGEICGRESGHCDVALLEFDETSRSARVQHFYRPLTSDASWQEESITLIS